MDINIMAAMEAAELVLERMSLESGGRGGLLVNTASLAGVVTDRNFLFGNLNLLGLETRAIPISHFCASHSPTK